LLGHAEKHLQVHHAIHTATKLAAFYYESGAPGTLFLLGNAADPLLNYPLPALKQFDSTPPA
jgi:hypothetical protein